MPAAQGEQEGESALENSPGAHAANTGAHAALAVPLAHAVQPPPAAVPGAHAAHDAAPTAPGAGCAVPAGQGAHESPSAAGAYVPAGHCVTHAAEPEDARSVPAGQCAVHMVPPVGDMEPAAHAGHAPALDTADEVPAAHAEQDAEPGGAKEPGGQTEHDVAPPNENDPAGQVADDQLAVGNWSRPGTA